MQLRILFLLALSTLCLAQDYYAILGLSRSASDKDIKSAYRQLSKKYHPDKNPGDEEAHHKFIEIGEAYEVLSDAEKKSTYDRFGAEAVKNGGQQQQQDPFGGMFNGFFGGQQQVRKGPDAELKYELTLKEYYNGKSFSVNLNLQSKCDHCKATGSEDGKRHKCPDCGGRGVKLQKIQFGPMTQQIQTTCNRCGGQGSLISKKCKVCHGQKVVPKDTEFFLDVPAGADRYYVETFPGKAEAHPDIETGDLFVKFSEAAGSNLGYRRRGHDLFRTEVLTLKEAMKGGWKREIMSLEEGESFILQRKDKEIVMNGEIEILSEHGMPTDHGHGDLYIEYKVVYPKGADLSRIIDEL